LRITRSSAVPSEQMEATDFSGVARRRDLGATDAPACRTLVVSFEPGARTHWHSHREGQLLYGLEGSGRVGTRADETADIGPGDLVYAPPGEEHWHGASADEGLTHVALSFGETDWFEEVR
jgi:quercetin dioxygenase-like cupin family protein